MTKSEPNFEVVPNEVSRLCNYAVQISNRDYLLRSHCAALGTDHSDVFAKARAYASVIRNAHGACSIPYGVPIQSRPGPTVRVEVDGSVRTMVMFASNDYLNLSTDPRVHEAVRKAIDEFGIGAGSSRINAGYSTLHAELENRLAAAMGKESAILFPTGYDAIVAAPQGLLTQNDRAVVDGSSHSSILEAAAMNGASVRMFSHNNVSRLEHTIERARRNAPQCGILVMVEAAYSMDGDIAKLPDIVKTCANYGARLLVDEAHAIGVYGVNGHGVCEHFGLSTQVDLIAGTFSKALGAVGGFVAAERDVILYMRYMCRRSVFSAALPPLIVAGVLAALQIIETDRALRERLWHNVRYLRNGLIQVGAKVLGTETASVPVLIGNDGVIFQLTEEMIAAGMFTFPAVYPAVPKDRSLLRLAVQAHHRKEHLDLAIDTLGRLLKKYGLPN